MNARGLIEFFAAQLDEDEEAAKRVRQPYRLYACADGCIEEPTRVDDPYGPANGEYQQWGDGEDRLPNHHNSWTLIYDPARALAEVAAKREIIRLYEETLVAIETFEGHGVEAQAHQVAAESYLNVVRIHAAVYAGRPGYREEWRP